MKSKIILFIAGCMAMGACTKTPDEGSGSSNALVNQEGMGIYIGEKATFIYNKEVHQYAFNTSRMTFRIQTLKQDRYFSCRLDSKPQTGKALKLSLETSGISNVPSQELVVTTLKTSDGKAWLWNEEKELGFIIKIE